MKRYLVAVAATLALATAGPAVSAPVNAPAATAAKSCSSSYTHAVINGAEKCLRRGQYCSHPADKQYHRYGFHCHKRDSYGSYHLT